MFRIFRIALFLLTFLFTSPVFALTAPDKPAGYVTDTIGLLSASAKADLEQTLGDFEKSTSNQIFVAVFDSLDGDSLEDFAVRLFKQWGVGQKEKDNGVLLVIFKSDRKMRIEVGYGLEGALPDALCSQIIRNEMAPLFRQGDFDGGVKAAVSAMMKATRGEYTASPESLDQKITQHSPFFFMILFSFFMQPIICYILSIVLGTLLFGFPIGSVWGLFAAIALFYLRVAWLGDASTTLAGRNRRVGWWNDFGDGGFGGGGSSGGGGGGSFGGGGGGGSSGGGGASGGW